MELFFSQAPTPLSAGSSLASASMRRPRPQTLTDSGSSEHLSMVADSGGGGGLGSAGSLHDSGGHVRFVDSTIR